MDNYIQTMKGDSPDRAFYRAILSVHQNQFPKALMHIARARDLLEPELSSFVGEGYGRSYKWVSYFIRITGILTNYVQRDGPGSNAL